MVKPFVGYAPQPIISHIKLSLANRFINDEVLGWLPGAEHEFPAETWYCDLLAEQTNLSETNYIKTIRCRTKWVSLCGTYTILFTGFLPERLRVRVGALFAGRIFPDTRPFK